MAGQSGTGYFWLRRMYTLSGLWLSFCFVFFFLVPYSSVFGGSESFNLFAIVANKIPLLGEIEFLFIFVPLAFHAAMGLSIVYGSQFNIITYPTYKNWMYFLGRVAGIFLIPFFAYHIYATNLIFAFSGQYADFAYLQKLLTPAWARVFYCAGVSCIAFYIGNSVSSALIKLGVTASKRSQDVTSMVMWALTFVIAVWGIRIVLSF